MRISNLTEGSSMYTSNVFLVLGTHNTLTDVNTLVDVGRDPNIIRAINEASTGVGKKRIAQVVLTHSHYDHTELLGHICRDFNPRVYGFSPDAMTDKCVVSDPQGTTGGKSPQSKAILKVSDGGILMLGDQKFEVLHAPGHSNDSICLFCADEGVLFSGDTPLDIRDRSGKHEPGFVTFLERLSRRDVRTVYPGHGPALTKGCNEMIQRSYDNVMSGAASVV